MWHHRFRAGDADTAADAGCDICSTAAACVSEPCSTMATRYSSALIENISAILFLVL